MGGVLVVALAYPALALIGLQVTVDLAFAFIWRSRKKAAQ